MELNHQLWLNIAKDMLAVLIVEDYTPEGVNVYNDAYHEKGLRDYHFPLGSYRTLYATIVKLRELKLVVNWTNIALHMPSHIEQRLYDELVEHYAGKLRVDAKNNIDHLIEYGKRSMIADALTIAGQSVTTGKDINQTVDKLIDRVTTLDDKTLTGETASASKSELDDLFDGVATTYPFTGTAFIDEVMGGITKGRMTVIAGAYKSRKTTWALNVMLNAYRQGMRPALLSLENRRLVSEAQIIAMLACDYIVRSGKVPYTTAASAYWISADGLMKARSAYKSWTPLKREAVEYARQAFHEIGDGMRFYGRDPKEGGISSIADIRNIIKRDMRLYGGDMFVIDHQNLINEQGEVYEKTSKVSAALMDISRISTPHEISLFVLAQLNEGAISGEETYSAGIKGGGDTSANADYVIRTTPIQVEGVKGKFYNNKVLMQVKHNRWGSSTGAEEVYFYPEAGLLQHVQLPTVERVSESLPESDIIF